VYTTIWICQSSDAKGERILSDPDMMALMDSLDVDATVPVGMRARLMVDDRALPKCSGSDGRVCRSRDIHMVSVSTHSHFPRFAIGDGFGSAAADAVDEIPAWPLARPNYASLDAAVQGEAARWNVPGMSVAVLHDGVIDTVAIGITSIQTKQPVTPDTIFQIGSISKVFATTVVMQLVDEGKLDLDAPVTTYVPELPLADLDARANLTLHHLLSHTGGFEGIAFSITGGATMRRRNRCWRWIRSSNGFSRANCFPTATSPSILSR